VFKNEIANSVSIVLVIILAALILIALVIWVFDKRIHLIENRVESAAAIVMD